MADNTMNDTYKAPITCHSQGSHREQSTPCVLRGAAATQPLFVIIPDARVGNLRACGCDPDSDDRNSVCGKYTFVSMRVYKCPHFRMFSFFVTFLCFVILFFIAGGPVSRKFHLSSCLLISVALGSIY